MTDLRRLKVSLTKYGAHRIAVLVHRCAPENLLGSTGGEVDGVKVDPSQMSRILSAYGSDLPSVWHEAHKIGRSAINALVLIAIAFSHQKLIKALQDSALAYGVGELKRQSLSPVKAFTNFKSDLINLGFSKRASSRSVVYDLAPIFRDREIVPLAREILKLKLVDAGWNRRGSLAEECVKVGFHTALGVTPEFFRDWLSGDAVSDIVVTTDITDVTDSNELSTPFRFRSQNSLRKTGTITRGPTGQIEVNLVHNQLQKLLQAELARLYGAAQIATEHPSGVANTYIDAVHRNGAVHTFFEIKTSRSCRSCIRDALPQLLEYAFWRDDEPATKLVVVAPCSATPQAKKYLRLLRNRFGIPVYFQQINRKTGRLSAEC